MNAISVRQPDAVAILTGREPVRHLAWQTSHRGPLLIHAAKQERGRGSAELAPGSVSNAVVGVVELADCVRDDLPGADPDEGRYYWVLINPRVFVSPLPAHGKVGLFQVSDEAVAAELARARAPRRRKPRAGDEG
jgi:hypothetical protein